MGALTNVCDMPDLSDLHKLDIFFLNSVVFVFWRLFCGILYHVFRMTKYSFRVMVHYVIIMTHLASITYQKKSNRTLSTIVIGPYVMVNLFHVTPHFGNSSTRNLFAFTFNLNLLLFAISTVVSRINYKFINNKKLYLLLCW